MNWKISINTFYNDVNGWICEKNNFAHAGIPIKNHISMVQREATDSDIPTIISLLKASLGESLLPKSEAYWRWKHVNNPFGVSPVLVAEEDEKLIGVRAFMRWQWSNDRTSIEAIRAVDTATHPEYQGKGIFTKLTTSLLKICEQRQLDMVFNTPNEKSMPGYLKMGWKMAGKLPVQIELLRPFGILSNFLLKNASEEIHDEMDATKYFFNHTGLPGLCTMRGKDFQTNYSPNFLRWRYFENPIVTYYAAGIEHGGDLRAIFFYRVKPSRLGLEFRVTDLFFTSKDDLKMVKKLLFEKFRFHRAHFATFAGNSLPILRGFLSFKSRELGPTVTVRDIAIDKIDDFMNFKQWSPSLGDMELF